MRERVFTLGLGPKELRLGETQTFSASLSPLHGEPGFRPLRIILPPQLIPHFIVTDIRCDSERQLFSEPPVAALQSVSLPLSDVQYAMSMTVRRVPRMVHEPWWRRVLLWLRIHKPYVEPETIPFAAAIMAYRLDTEHVAEERIVLDVPNIRNRLVRPCDKCGEHEDILLTTCACGKTVCEGCEVCDNGYHHACPFCGAHLDTSEEDT